MSVDENRFIRFFRSFLKIAVLGDGPEALSIEKGY